MKRIAILTYEKQEWFSNYGDDSHEAFISQYITDWTEVTDEDFEYLRCNRHYRPNTMLIEYPTDQSKLIVKTVEDIKNHIIKEKKQEEDRIRKNQEAKEKAKATKLAKKADKIKKEFEALKAQGLV